VKITVIGLGYVGLTTALCLTRWGHQVIGADISSEKIMALNAGVLPIWEPQLDKLLDQAKDEKAIRFTTDIAAAVSEGEVLFICVGTPAGENGRPDLSQLRSLIKPIAFHANDGAVVVIKSTVPIGTTDTVEKGLYLLSGGKSWDIVHNPEFLRQGKAVTDFLHPDRIVVGTRSSVAACRMRKLYQAIDAPFITCDPRSAEIIKYAANGFLAMKISYANMMAPLCESWGADIEAVIKGVGSDRRITPSHLQPGVGFGGSCFPKDTEALLAMGRAADCPMPLVEALQEINRLQPQRVLDKLKQELGSLQGKRIGLLGLTFKPDSDDLREAPSLAISRLARQSGAVVQAYDPLVRHYPVAEVRLVTDPHELLETCDGIILVTEWEEFRKLSWRRLHARPHPLVLVDGRNLFSLEEMRRIAEETGLVYLSVGRPPVRRKKRKSLMNSV
jgi:UDPglucose 6-dehydrogenase